MLSAVTYMVSWLAEGVLEKKLLSDKERQFEIVKKGHQSLAVGLNPLVSEKIKN